MAAYALWSRVAQTWITYQGRVLTHDVQGELEFLFPDACVRPINGVPDQDRMPIKQHPDMAPVRWPLRKDDFW